MVNFYTNFKRKYKIYNDFVLWIIIGFLVLDIIAVLTPANWHIKQIIEILILIAIELIFFHVILNDLLHEKPTFRLDYLEISILATEIPPNTDLKEAVTNYLEKYNY